MMWENVKAKHTASEKIFTRRHVDCYLALLASQAMSKLA